jgi:hypothetical protein
MPLSRRSQLAGAALPPAAAQAARVPKFVPQANPTPLDPSWPAVRFIRARAMMAYAILHRTDSANAVSSQMSTGCSLYWNVKRGHENG